MLSPAHRFVLLCCFFPAGSSQTVLCNKPKLSTLNNSLNINSGVRAAASSPPAEAFYVHEANAPRCLCLHGDTCTNKKCLELLFVPLFTHTLPSCADSSRSNTHSGPPSSTLMKTVGADRGGRHQAAVCLPVLWSGIFSSWKTVQPSAEARCFNFN